MKSIKTIFTAAILVLAFVLPGHAQTKPLPQFEIMTEDWSPYQFMRDGVLVAVNALNRPKDFIHAKKAIAAKVTPDSQRLADPEVPIKSL